MKVFAYPKKRAIARIAQDGVVLLATLWLFIAQPIGAFSYLLAAAGVVVLLWQVVTLHYPREVSLSEQGIAFRAYGRVHRFAWSEVQACRVRKFLVGDRVLVRLAPATAFRGRYWLLESMENYGALVCALEARARCFSPIPAR